MSLDVYLFRERLISYDGGTTQYPDNECVYESNITHNLTEMASEAGLYNVLWQPEVEYAEYALQIIPNLEIGLTLLKSDPDRFRAFNPKNGWGTYEGLVNFVETYLTACKEYPQAKIYISR